MEQRASADELLDIRCNIFQISHLAFNLILISTKHVSIESKEHFFTEILQSESISCSLSEDLKNINITTEFKSEKSYLQQCSYPSFAYNLYMKKN